MGKTDFSGCFQRSVYCHFCSSLLSCSARKRFTTWPLSRQNRRFLCAERAKSAKTMRYDKAVAVHSLGPDVFLLAALGKRAKGKETCQEAGSNVTGWRIRIAKVPTFAFPTDSYGMQTKFPFAKLPGLQCWWWFKLTGCTQTRVSEKLSHIQLSWPWRGHADLGARKPSAHCSTSSRSQTGLRWT